MRKLFFYAFISCGGFVFSQAGVGSGAYCLPDYWNKPCAQPNASNDPANYINDMIDAFYTTGGVTNINTNNTGCQSQMIAGILQNYYHYGCPTHLRATSGSVITCNFLSGIIFGQGFAVYVDWNKDCAFTLAEMVCGTPNVPAPATWSSANFTIPAGTAAGAYRLRVRCSYATVGTSIDPCLQYSYGETHDYTMFIGSNCDANLPVCSALPITLSSFSAKINDEQVDIQWSTATEYRNDYFILEKSYDGKSFEFFEKINGAGSSNGPKNYFTVDKHPYDGLTYYRLKQFDFDGAMWKSEIIVVETAIHEVHLKFVPNPASDNISVLIPNSASLLSAYEITNSAGAVVRLMKHVNTENNRLLINVKDLPEGFYLMTIYSTNGCVFRGKFVKS